MVIIDTFSHEVDVSAATPEAGPTPAIALESTSGQGGASHQAEAALPDVVLSQAAFMSEHSDVQWMLTGEAACSVNVAEDTSVAGVKAQVHQLTGIPVKEQRLFLKGSVLDDSTPVASVVADMGSSTESFQLVRTTSDPLETCLGFFHPAPGNLSQALPEGEFTKVRRLGSGVNGDVMMYRRALSSSELKELVAVKVLPAKSLVGFEGFERNDRRVHFKQGDCKARCCEDALTEVGVMKFLSQRSDLPLYLLQLQGLFSCPFGDVWLVTELCEGGELFAEVQKRGVLPPMQANAYAWQLLQAVGYLHRHQIGHRDISLENILLKGGQVRLMDFGMAVRSVTDAGTALRYFQAVGKHAYRAPECYVPGDPEVIVQVPKDAQPGEVHCMEVCGMYLCEVRLPADAVQGQSVKAEVWGYAATQADIWSAGVSISIMLIGCPTWHTATVGDELFNYVREYSMAELLRHWRKPALAVQAQALLDSMLSSQPGCRPNAMDCLAMPWFDSKRKATVPTHSKVCT